MRAPDYRRPFPARVDRETRVSAGRRKRERLLGSSPLSGPMSGPNRGLANKAWQQSYVHFEPIVSDHSTPNPETYRTWKLTGSRIAATTCFLVQRKQPVSSSPTINWLECGSLAVRDGHLSDRVDAVSTVFSQRSLCSKGGVSIIPQRSEVRVMDGGNKPLKCNKLHT